MTRPWIVIALVTLLAMAGLDSAKPRHQINVPQLSEVFR